jgi:hypothetical protein
MTGIDPKFWPAWGLPADTSEETADRVFRTLDVQLKRRFGSVLQPTPGQTGVLAWRRLQEGRKGVVGGIWPVLPLDLRTIIRETSGQGRFECCPVPRPAPTIDRGPWLPNLYCLDMQLAYAAAAIHLQAGKEWRHETGMRVVAYEGLLANTPGWYRVRFEVPVGWQHVGILPVHVPGGAGGWRWPTMTLPHIGIPGVAEDETWASHHEVALAVECGWRVEILERIVAVVPEGISSYPRPLQLWAEKLIEMREEQGGDRWRGAVRNILLHTIGSFARGPKRVTRQVFGNTEVPDHELARSTMRLTESGWQYEDYAPGGGDAAYQHPEWAALIWGWTRARLLRGMHYVNKEKVPVGALELPREQIVGFALDCIYTTHDPGWTPSRVGVKWPSTLGDFRVKRHVPGPLQAPRTLLDIYKISGEVAE